MSRKKFTIDRILLGERIKIIRKDKDLNQQGLAKALDISSGYVSEVEQGNKLPGGKVLYSLKKVFDVNINWLLTGEGPKYQQEYQYKNPPDTVVANHKPLPYEVDPITEKILIMLQDMEEEKKRDVLKYLEEKKLLLELLEERKKKGVA